MTLEPAFLKTLFQIHDRLVETAVLWVVTGSLGLALQGVPVAVHDIDLQTDAYQKLGRPDKVALLQNWLAQEQ